MSSPVRQAGRLQLFAEPIAVLLIVAAVLVWAFTGELDSIEQRNITFANILTLTWEHLQLTAAISVIVLLAGVPLGVLVSRRWARHIAPLVLGLATIGQAAPAVGVLVLFFLLTGQTGFWIAVLPMAVYALLPVLRNTLVGLQQVDRTLVEAGRGIGMSAFTVLRRIEFPLAIPHVLAGMRTALVLAVGVATLAMFVNGGGLGSMIDTGYKLRRTSILVVGAVLAAALALLVDWLGGLAERRLGPKGLR